MTEADIKDLALRIADASGLAHWKSYVLLAVCAFVGSALAHFLGAYFKRRGENFATKADFDALLDQVRQTTRATEEIRRRVSHKGWLEQQRHLTRREKLEELLRSIHELHFWLDREKDHILYEAEPNESPDPSYRIEILRVLYFNDLSKEILAFSRAALNFKKWLIENQYPLRVARLKNDVDAQMAQIESASKGYGAVYASLADATTQIERKTTEAMKETLRT